MGEARNMKRGTSTFRHATNALTDSRKMLSPAGAGIGIIGPRQEGTVKMSFGAFTLPRSWLAAGTGLYRPVPDGQGYPHWVASPHAPLSRTPFGGDTHGG